MIHKEKIIAVTLSILVLSAFFTGCAEVPAENIADKGRILI